MVTGEDASEWMFLTGWFSYETNNPTRRTNLGAPTAEKSTAISQKIRRLCASKSVLKNNDMYGSMKQCNCAAESASLHYICEPKGIYT